MLSWNLEVCLLFYSVPLLSHTLKFILPLAQPTPATFATMPPRSYSYSSSNNASYDDQYSDIDADSCTKSIYVCTPPLAKSVRFSNQVEIFFVERIDDYSADEIAAVWYDKDDFEQIKNEVKAMVHFMETGTQVLSEKTSIRGLEHRTRAGAWSKFHNKRIAYCAVLDEQDNQWKNSICDSGAIAQVYMDHSVFCRNRALQIGRRDAIAARTVHHFSPINKYQRRKNR